MQMRTRFFELHSPSIRKMVHCFQTAGFAPVLILPSPLHNNTPMFHFRRTMYTLTHSRLHSLGKSLTLLALLLALVLSSMQGRAQSTQGAISGSVKDAAGAVVAGATITLTNTDEG